MADRPILFSAPMVRAMLDGRKTQTRRILKPQSDKSFRGIYAPGLSAVFGDPDHPTEDDLSIRLFSLKDRLWVRESWSGPFRFAHIKPKDRYGSGWFGSSDVWYWADGDPDSGDWEKPRPSIHMPRRASRLTLTVTDVRVQRLQAITAEDAIAEGIEPTACPLIPDGHLPTWRNYITGADDLMCEVESFRTLWDSINAERGFGWAANPWVVAYRFTVAKQNIDQLEAA